VKSNILLSHLQKSHPAHIWTKNGYDIFSMMGGRTIHTDLFPTTLSYVKKSSSSNYWFNDQKIHGFDDLNNKEEGLVQSLEYFPDTDVFFLITYYKKHNGYELRDFNERNCSPHLECDMNYNSINPVKFYDIDWFVKTTNKYLEEKLKTAQQNSEIQNIYKTLQQLVK
jgi:hypothetical protein